MCQSLFQGKDEVLSLRNLHLIGGEIASEQTLSKYTICQKGVSAIEEIKNRKRRQGYRLQLRVRWDPTE